MLSENDITRIAGRIASHYAPLVVGIFGSYAIGAARASSDLDLFVIKACPNGRPAAAGGAAAVIRGAASAGYPCIHARGVRGSGI